MHRGDDDDDEQHSLHYKALFTSVSKDEEKNTSQGIFAFYKAAIFNEVRQILYHSRHKVKPRSWQSYLQCFGLRAALHKKDP